MSGLIRRLLITGGAGFIGSNFTRLMLRNRDVERVTVLDKLTYAGNRANLRDLADDERLELVIGDIADSTLVHDLARDVEAIVNFAAESHVDRSIDTPDSFIQTDVYGTMVLLEAARRHGHSRYLQVSTDEVYGDVRDGSSTELDPLLPRSPYAASKASGDLLVGAYYSTHKVPALITRASNTFGPYQYPEKLIPLFVTNAIDDEALPLYGDGGQVRDWLYVLDHCEAIAMVLERGSPGEVYNIAGGNELTNLEVTRAILGHLEKPLSLVRSVTDRPGHDRRYSVDASKIRKLGWEPARPFQKALAETVEWYSANEEWWRPLKGDAYQEYYRRQYGHRLATGTRLR